MMSQEEVKNLPLLKAFPSQTIDSRVRACSTLGHLPVRDLLTTLTLWRCGFSCSSAVTNLEVEVRIVMFIGKAKKLTEV